MNVPKNEEDYDNKDKICPLELKEKILQLRKIEEYLGNIPKSSTWKSDRLTGVSKQVFNPEALPINEQLSELVFARICKELSEKGFSADQIASWINESLSFEGFPPYCNSFEVKESL